MQIDRDVESPPPEVPRQPEVVGHARPAALVRDRDHVGEVRVVGDDGRGAGFDEIGETRRRVVPAQRANHRRREDDVADEPKADEKDVQRRVSVRWSPRR